MDEQKGMNHDLLRRLDVCALINSYQGMCYDASLLHSAANEWWLVVSVHRIPTIMQTR